MAAPYHRSPVEAKGRRNETRPVAQTALRPIESARHETLKALKSVRMILTRCPATLSRPGTAFKSIERTGNPAHARCDIVAMLLKNDHLKCPVADQTGFPRNVTLLT
jgi:hypothetical protein